MTQGTDGRLRVALLAENNERAEFRSLLEQQDISIVLEHSLGGSLPESWNGAEVLLVGIGDRYDVKQLEALLKRSPVPVLLSHGGVGHGQIWHRRLLGKLQTLATRAMPGAALHSRQSRPELHVVQDSALAGVGSPWLVVLGASIGGPKAVTRLLSALPADLPVAFLLAQHISETFQDLLVEQLDRCSDWPVALLGDAQMLRAGEVWLVPAECRIEVQADGSVKRLSQVWGSTCRPDIDDVLARASEAFGSRCGAILLSGLGKDGAAGCGAVAERGGFVWAQSAESCVIANLPDTIRRSCDVELSGTPEELARALSARCQLASACIN
jgi:chemosensory pili system protein ChpB (putative protein-glutamate methylesterase)